MRARRDPGRFVAFPLIVIISVAALNARAESPPGTASTAPMPAHIDPNTAVEIQDDNGTTLKLTPTEMVGYMMVYTVDFMQSDCLDKLGKPCTTEQLRKGAVLRDGKRTWRFMYDPDTDPNYSYVITSDKRGWEVHANPKRPGLIGFYISAPDGSNTKYFNRKGAATNKDEKIGANSVVGTMFFMD